MQIVPASDEVDSTVPPTEAELRLAEMINKLLAAEEPPKRAKARRWFAAISRQDHYMTGLY